MAATICQKKQKKESGQFKNHLTSNLILYLGYDKDDNMTRRDYEEKLYRRCYKDTPESFVILFDVAVFLQGLQHFLQSGTVYSDFILQI